MSGGGLSGHNPSRGYASGIQWLEAEDAAKHLKVRRIVPQPQTENYVTPKVSDAAAEKPCFNISQ